MSNPKATPIGPQYWVCVPGKTPKSISAIGFPHKEVDTARQFRQTCVTPSAIYALEFGALPKFIEGDAITGASA